MKQKNKHNKTEKGRYREQTSSYQWLEGKRERQNKYIINKLQVYTVQNREYSQYFIITLN